MKLSDFDFDLPEDLIALRPLRPRPASRLLVSHKQGLTDAHVGDLGQFLRAGDLLVLNDTRVIPARLTGLRSRITGDGTGQARVEVNLIARKGDVWTVLARPARKLSVGDRIVFGALSALVRAKGEGGEVSIEFSLQGNALQDALQREGVMPLPPYIASKRQADAQDAEDYQTVFARKEGAVAAPTASLHFDEDLLAGLASMGIRFTHVTLHVGAGTFLPVKTEDVDAHRMHAEWGEIADEAAAEIADCKRRGGRVIAVGTTALRLIEAAGGGPFRGETDIFIRPGYRFVVTDGLMTNFHLPKSTLLMLVAALVGVDRQRAIYAHAIAGRYRFFSYGDASLLFP